ncbi:unnamed protein product [Mytilus coruscus]|uniref:Uncharacterized protein n=1 Tax=Mytilus coruscus TaxID=42192 RepID=A0A6J8BXM4_MYTCO|nr:unnamed protein product [Mytilus coruscus]
MCQNIVGTEEHVKSIRMMNSVKDNLASNKTVQTITSGSYGEGIEMRGSDIDIMKILKFIEVFEDKNTPLNPHKSHCAMETDETLPGFTQLRLLQGNRYFFAMSQNREDQFLDFNNQVFYRIQISNNPHVDIVEKLLISKMFLVTEEMLRTAEYTFDNKIHLLCTESSKIRHIYSYYISKLCFNNVQLLPLKDISNNKSNYRQYKICLSTLLQNVHHDAVSGWLLLATFFYKTKQYNLATYVLQYSLSKLQLLTNITNIHIFRKMTVAQLLTLLRVDDVHFRKNSTFIPDELAIEVKSKPCIIPPVLYAHFLCFLCHFHLTNTRQCRDSLQDLKLTIEEKFFIPDNSDNALGHNILGIAFQLAGDIESAKWAFLQSIRLGPNPDTN